jgi:hypothetical protein
LQSSLLRRLEFASLLAYSPRPAEVSVERRGEADLSHNLVLALKEGKATGDPATSVPDQIARHIQDAQPAGRKLAEYFPASATLVPVPRSTLLTAGALWVPQQLCQSLVAKGLGTLVSQALERTEPIPKAARSVSAERPTAARNFDTLRVTRGLEVFEDILLVDDVVTAGATLLGAASRLHEAYPLARIRGFAAARTISNGTEFRALIEPVTGSIDLRADGRCHRSP